MMVKELRKLYDKGLLSTKGLEFLLFIQEKRDSNYEIADKDFRDFKNDQTKRGWNS